jgi:hypothetical protein
MAPNPTCPAVFFSVPLPEMIVALAELLGEEKNRSLTVPTSAQNGFPIRARHMLFHPSRHCGGNKGYSGWGFAGWGRVIE